MPRGRPRQPATVEQLETIRVMRLGGATWDAIALALGMHRDWVTQEACGIGVWVPGNKPAQKPKPVLTMAERYRKAREDAGPWPLPAGHPISLGVLRGAGLVIEVRARG